MNNNFFKELRAAVKSMAEENSMTNEEALDIIQKGFTAALRKENPRCENFRVEIDLDKKIFEAGVLKFVVDGEAGNSFNEISIDDAKAIDKKCSVGEMCFIPTPPEGLYKAAMSNVNMQLFFKALELMAEENSISKEDISLIIQQGFSKAIKREYPSCDNILVTIDTENCIFEMGLLKLVVDDEPLDLNNEINISEAKAIDSDCAVGEMCFIPVPPERIGRVAVQNAKQQIRHELKNHEREHIIAQFKDKLYECLSAKVDHIEGRTGNAVLTLDKSEVYLIRQEQIPGEVLNPGDTIKIYVVGIVNPEKKPSLKISRTHKDMVKRLFENEVPEIADGTVEIKAISRVAGSRTKMAVKSNDKNVDAIGACIGPRMSRISAVMKEINGEKIDLIPYSEDPEKFIASAISPAQVKKVIVDGTEGVRACKVVVPANQLSLAIGNKGQNARLAAGLTGYRIDIISDVEYKEMKESLENSLVESEDDMLADEQPSEEQTLDIDDEAEAFDSAEDEA